MYDVLLIKKLNMRTFNKQSVIPVTFNVGVIEDKCFHMQFFKSLKEKQLVQSDKIVIKNDTITVDVLPDDITEIMKELLLQNQSIYGIYILYDNYLGGDNNE